MAKVAQRLGVNEHEVVPAWEATQRGLPVQAAMRTGRIVMLQPPGEHTRAIRGGVVRAPIGPLAERSLDEALGLAVSPRGAGPGPAMEGVQGPTRGSETAREISGPVVGEDAADPNAVGAKPLQRAAQKPRHRVASLVGQELHEGHARMVIHGHVQALPADAAMAGLSVAGNPMADAADAAQLLRVEVQQIVATAIMRSVALPNCRIWLATTVACSSPAGIVTAPAGGTGVARWAPTRPSPTTTRRKAKTSAPIRCDATAVHVHGRHREHGERRAQTSATC